MTKLKILTAPNQALHMKTNKVSRLDNKVLKLTKDMRETLKKSKIPGMGLSATQVGIPLSVFVVHLMPKTSSSTTSPPFDTFAASVPTVFINPQILWYSKKLNTDVLPEEKLYLEGCLSVPKIYALIKRPWAIKVKYKTLDNRYSRIANRESHFEGFNATLIQHEVDHLNGILFTDRALEQGSQIYEVGENEELHPVIL